MTAYLNELADRRGLPKVIVCDNGPEFTSKAQFFWSRETGVKPHYIQRCGTDSGVRSDGQDDPEIHHDYHLI